MCQTMTGNPIRNGLYSIHTETVSMNVDVVVFIELTHPYCEQQSPYELL